MNNNNNNRENSQATSYTVYSERDRFFIILLFSLSDVTILSTIEQVFEDGRLWRIKNDRVDLQNHHAVFFQHPMLYHNI
jgi:hypothetical protein